MIDFTVPVYYNFPHYMLDTWIINFISTTFFYLTLTGQNNQGSSNIKKKRKKVNNKNAKNVPNISANNELSEQEKLVVVSSLHRVLKPFLLRRIKSDVILDLPQKVCKESSTYDMVQISDFKTICNLYPSCLVILVFIYVDTWLLLFSFLIVLFSVASNWFYDVTFHCSLQNSNRWVRNSCD